VSCHTIGVAQLTDKRIALNCADRRSARYISTANVFRLIAKFPESSPETGWGDRCWQWRNCLEYADIKAFHQQHIAPTPPSYDCLVTPDKKMKPVVGDSTSEIRSWTPSCKFTPPREHAKLTAEDWVKVQAICRKVKQTQLPSAWIAAKLKAASDPETLTLALICPCSWGEKRLSAGSWARGRISTLSAAKTPASDRLVA